MPEVKRNKRGFHLSTWIKRLIWPGKELDFLQEEAVISPMRSVLKRFFHNKIALTGLVILTLMFLLVLIGPLFFPLDISYSDSTQQNLPPSVNMMKVPEALKENLQDIGPGTSYGVGCDKGGKVYTWGYTKITERIDLSDIPVQVQNDKIVDVAAGHDHVVALSEDGILYAWGNDRLGQCDIPASANRGNTFVQIDAGAQFSAALTDEGRLYLWGNASLADIKIKDEYQGDIVKFAMCDYAYVCLMRDGSVQYTGYKTSTTYANIPEALNSGVVDISASGNSFIAIKDDGSVYVWGNVANGEGQIPEYDGKIVEIHGGRNHYIALLDTGEIIAWGNNHFGQVDIPKALDGGENQGAQIYVSYFQNYVVTESGDVVTWGLKGYPLGTDYLGRDILTRLINGGRVTMTVGAVAVIICMILGLIIGGIAGYFGGKLDIVLMRIAEVVNGIPFLPLAMILSSLIPPSVTLTQRMYLIMVVMGALQWPSLATLVRAQILRVREQEYVMAAKAMGVKEGKIVSRHIIPNIMSVILVNVALSFATCMLYESSLSYLGFGIIPPTPTWGNMLTGCNSSVVIQQFWWRWVFPALALGICTIATNLIGDGMRDAIDPKSEDR